MWGWRRYADVVRGRLVLSESMDHFIDATLSDISRRGLIKKIHVLEGAAEPTVIVDGKRCIQLASNNYLGLTTHPKIRAAAIEAFSLFGAGAGAVMPITGTMTIHQECERSLAELKGTPAALLMQSGYSANVGTISGLLGPGDVVISDETNHASIIDGIRLSGADKKIYPHLDLNTLEQHLEDASGYAKCLVVTDSVFSMEGDIAPLPEIASLAQTYGAALMVDDAHATGVLGKNGGGSVEHFDLQGRVDIQIGTLSKAIGAVGGFVAATKGVIELLRHKSRPFLFSSGLPPSVAASVKTAIDLIREEPWRRQKLWKNSNFFKNGLKDLGFHTGSSKTPITPVVIGESNVATEMSERLKGEGVLASAIVFPMVPELAARIRTIVMGTHSQEELTDALGAFERIGKDMGVIS